MRKSGNFKSNLTAGNMSSLADRNSVAAAELAKKKKERLARANQLKAERDTQKSVYQSTSATKTENAMSAEYAPLELGSDSKMTLYRIPSGSSKQSGSSIPQLPSNVETSTFSTLTISASDIAKYSTPASHRQVSMEAPKGLLQVIENTGSVVAKSDVYSTSSLLFPRSLHAQLTNSERFFCPPGDPAGRLIDTSNLPSLCMSTNHSSEVIVGSSDHALYSIDITNPNKRPVTMHSKTCGHSDWVTGVAHLQDGRVISCSMDSKLCLWDASRRRCDNLDAHAGSISKVISDTRYNAAVSVGYDRKVIIWSFGDSVVKGGVRARAKNSGITPSMVLGGHGAPVLDCAFLNDRLVSGSKDGAVFMWDVTTGNVLAKYRAHKGPVTNLGSLMHEEQGLFMSAGTDGFVKIWDTRERNAVARIPSHTQDAVGGSSTAAVATLACTWSPDVQNGGGGVGGYILAGGSDSSIALIDPRVISSSDGDNIHPHAIVDRWAHHNNGIYSMCLVGGRCLFTGDGAGLMNCYDIFDGSSALKYGLGASSQGAVQTITCVAGKIVAAGEDGKVLIFAY